MTTNHEAEELITYLDSNDSEVVKQFKNIVQENLYSSQDHNLLDTLVDQYIHTKSDRLIELLVGVSESHSSHLFEKLNEHLKHGAHLAVCTLLFCIVRKQPSWLHKIVGTSLFSNFLKILKTDNNFILIMNGIIILCTLIPCVPAILAPYHGEILEVFVHSASLLLNKSGNIPEVCTLHLHVGVYIFFHRLYSMYPNNFLSYMRSHFAGKRHPVFQQVIKPMLEFVKFHPGLITDTSKSEASLEKWKIFQPHDILAECQKLSLDPLDSIKEASYVGYFESIEALVRHPHSQYHQQQHKTETSTTILNLNTVFANPDSSSMHVSEKEKKEKTSDKLSKLNEHFPICNPSDIIGNNTPPSSRTISPSNSAHDISSVSSKHLPAEQCEANHELNGSTQTLNDSGIDRKSSGESISINSIRSPANHNRTNSVENVHQKSSMLKSFLSSNHSTPLDKDNCRKSTPNSPRKTSGSKSLKNRPISTEFFLKSKLAFGHTGQHDIQSAPTSPMVQNLHGNSTNSFSFNETSDTDTSDLPTEDIKEVLISCSKLSSHSIATDAHVNLQKDTTSLNIISDLKNMFCEVLASTRDANEVPSEMIDEAVNSTANTTASNHQQHSRSPFNLLDDFIQYGCTLHSSILNRIPLTSQLDTDWNYYGNMTSTDEQKILQMQVHMLHIQLLYERYKSKLHCLRNRRLFGNLQRTHSVQNEVDSLKDRLSLTESKLKEVKFTLKLKSEEIREIRKCHMKKEKELNARISELEENNRALQYKLRSCEAKKRAEQDKNQTLQKELHKVKSLLFEATKEILNYQPKVKNIESLTAVVDILQKELVTQVQKQERMRNSIDNFQIKNNKEMQLEAKLRAHRYELEELRDQNDLLCSQIEELKLKLHEMESVFIKKEKTIRDQKQQFNRIHEKHKKELQVYSDRFESCKKTCQSLQSYITSLHSKVEGTEHRRNHSFRKSATIASLDIPNLPIQHSHHDHSHRHSMNLHKSSDNPFSNKSRNSTTPDATIQQ